MAKRKSMAYRIVWTKKARKSSANVIDYLELSWSEKVVNNFIEILDWHVKMLASGKLTGTIAKKKNVRSLLLTKHNRLYYRILKDTIQIILIWDTRQNPARNPYD